VGLGRIGQRGPQKSNDVEVMEVLIDLADGGLLVIGLRVDVFFRPEKFDKSGCWRRPKIPPLSSF
jgi:hypothetical protein